MSEKQQSEKNLLRDKIEKEAGIWMSHLPVPNSNLCSLAEGVGFEPTCPKGQTVFKTASL